MKTIKYSILLALLVSAIASCEKDEEKVILNDNAKAPEILTPANGTSYTLTSAEESKNILFTWSEPDYNVNTSAVFQLDVDKENGAFLKPEKLALVYNDSAIVTYKTLNTAVIGTKIKLPKGAPGVVSVRLISILGRDTLFAKQIKLTVTPY